MVIISIRVKMLIIYSLIIILTFSVFSNIILNNYRTKAISSEEARLFQTANVVADTYKGYIEDIVSARIMVKSYANQINGRIIVLDKDREVLIDNYNSYIGQKLNNREIRNSFNNQSTYGIYEVNGKEVLQLSVPISLNFGTGPEIYGAVLISSSINHINEEVADLKNDIFKVAIGSLSMALILTAISVTGITRSLRRLILGVENISSGQLGYRIEKSKGGEIGRLIDTFNDMSEKLYNIEKNRKSLINSISHELKTPLTSIRVLIDSLLLGNNNKETYNEYLQDIKGETERMEDLITYLMGSIKLEEINLDIKRENIGEVIEESVKIIRPYALKNNVDIRLDGMPNISIQCDKNKLKEVFLNLLENGIKYKDNNKKENYISIRLEELKHRSVISIEDNGVGIDKDDLENIFDRGFRVLGSGKIEGYGIGLAIVKNIVDKHNWTINVNSELGVGTVFTIEI